MMTNLLAILLSVAMLLAGAPATGPAAETGRVMTLGNLEISHNDEAVALSPFALFGVTADGERAVIDFHVDADGETYLPLQAVVTADSLLLRSDGADTTVKVTNEDLAALTGADGEDAQGFEFMGDYIAAYVKVMDLMRDRAAMQALRDRSWALYGEIVERGAAKPAQVEYEGELYDVDTYEYTLDGRQIGALTDAICAEDARMADYVEAYFAMLAAAPEELGFGGVSTFEELLQKFDVSMRVFESIADNGLDILDGKMTVAVPDHDPILVSIHQSRFGETEYSTAEAEVVDDNLALTVYGEYSRDGADAHVTYNLTGNPAQAAPAEDAEGVETDASATEGDAETEENGGDEDLIYFTFDYDLTGDADNDIAEEIVNCTLDVTEPDVHADFNLDGQHDARGVGATHISGYFDMGEDAWSASCDVVVTDDLVAQRANEADAVALADLDAGKLLAGLSGDAMKLYAREDVRALVGLFAAAGGEEDADEDEPDDDAGELPFAEPTFGWLPLGFALSDVDVDPQYEDVTCTLVNDETGAVITVDVTTSYDAGEVKRFVVRDGECGPLDGLLVTEEDYGDFFMYSADDGTVSLTVYPDTKDVPAEDVLKLIQEIKF
ncbi:MAG: hypothetical protein IJ646_07075 [Clostridia bacterium]|nr:hypothetical protein [Clostridia bacterium]